MKKAIQFFLLAIVITSFQNISAQTQADELEKMETNSGFMLACGGTFTLLSIPFLYLGTHDIEQGYVFNQSSVGSGPGPATNVKPAGIALTTLGSALLAGGVTLLIFGGHGRYEYHLKKSEL